MEFALIAAVFISLFAGYFISKKMNRQQIETNDNIWKERYQQQENLIQHQTEEIKNLQAVKEKMFAEKEMMSNELAVSTNELKNLQQKLTDQKGEIVQLQEKFTQEFENLAQRILDQKSEKFTDVNKNNMQQILEPLKERILAFENKVEKTKESFIKGHSELGQQLKDLNEQNLRISKEAQNLTKALKGEAKTQGNWGELILKRVLEKSGLAEGREYELQESFKTEDGKHYYPDVIINLPNEKKMIIDAKVSLTAYEKYSNAVDVVAQKKFLSEHIKSVENHLKELKAKNYQDLSTDSPDFILMFIPIEAALHLAQSEHPNFFFSAFQENILLVSPTTLLSTLRTVDMLWKNEKQQQNALEIAQHAGKLYDKFANLVDELNSLGDRIKSTQGVYDSAMKKLTGKQNLIKEIEALKALGVSTKKQINPTLLSKATKNEE
ncbi:MAG: DNA recombination protein RmuC [Bacteroidota bacterium]